MNIVKKVINYFLLQKVLNMLNLSTKDVELYLNFSERFEKCSTIKELNDFYPKIQFITEYRELVIKKYIKLSNSEKDIVDLFKILVPYINCDDLCADDLGKIERLYPKYKENVNYIEHNYELDRGYIDFDFTSTEKEEKLLESRIESIKVFDDLKNLYEEIKIHNKYKYYFRNEILICFPNIQRLIFKKMIKIASTFDEIFYLHHHLHGSGNIAFFREEYKDSWEKLNFIATNKANETEDFTEVFRMYRLLPNFGDAYDDLSKRCADLTKTPEEALLVNLHIGGNHSNYYQFYAKKKTTPILLEWIDSVKDLEALKGIHKKLKNHHSDDGVVMEKLLIAMMEAL